jgi:hypothetical protein
MVGTVWLPLLTFSTIFAASGTCSMSTSANSIPARFNCPFNRWQ